MPIKLVIFDMDGVLVDACEWHRIALNEALKESCGYQISLEDHYREYNGIPTKIKLQKLADSGIISKSLFKQIESLKQDKTIEAIEKFAIIRQEKVELMKFLKQKNIKIACYTNSIKKTAEMMLNKTGILDYFDLLISNQDVAEPKPNPEGYLKIIDFFNIKKEECLIVEDSPSGLNAANLSGANVLKVDTVDDVYIGLFEGNIT